MSVEKEDGEEMDPYVRAEEDPVQKHLGGYSKKKKKPLLLLFKTMTCG
jgi:hypothetical protein